MHGIDPMIYGDAFQAVASLDQAMSCGHEAPEALGAHKLVHLAPLPETMAASAERKRAVGKFLTGLKPRQRELLELIYWEGLTQREAATLCGISESAVSQSVAKTLERGRSELARFQDCCTLH